MVSWFYLINIKYFDVFEAFAAGVKYWPVKTKVSRGDTIYIYLADPYKQIAFECEVVRTGIEREEIFAEVAPFRKYESKGTYSRKFMELDVVKSIPIDKSSPLSYVNLKERGLKGRLMWPRNLDNTPELLAYIKGYADEIR